MLYGKMFPVNTEQSLHTKSKEIKQGLLGTRKSSRAQGWLLQLLAIEAVLIKLNC